MSLRLRLALSYILFLVPALVVFSAAVYFIASSRIYGALDDSVLGRIDSVAADTGEQPLTDIETLRQNLASLDAASGSDFVFKVVGSSGEVLYASSRDAAVGLPNVTSLSRGPDNPVNWGTEGRQLRVAYQAYPSNDNPQAYIIGAVSLKQTDAAINELRGVFVAGAILVVLLTGATGLLPGRAVAAPSSRGGRSSRQHRAFRRLRVRAGAAVA